MDIHSAPGEMICMDTAQQWVLDRKLLRSNHALVAFHLALLVVPRFNGLLLYES